MSLVGGCYCGALRYKADGAPVLKAQCHCRACSYISGGAPNMFMLMPPEGFAYTKGTPKQFRRPDIENAVTREFCETCGTHILTRRPGLPQIVLKAGTLDDFGEIRVLGKQAAMAGRRSRSTPARSSRFI